MARPFSTAFEQERKANMNPFREDPNNIIDEDYTAEEKKKEAEA